MKLAAMSQLFGAFAPLEPTHFYMHFAALFIEVCKAHDANKPCTIQDLMSALDLDNSSTNRTVHALGKTNRKGKPGFNLLETVQDPAEGRRFLVKLTPRGKAFKRQLELI